MRGQGEGGERFEGGLVRVSFENMRMDGGCMEDAWDRWLGMMKEKDTACFLCMVCGILRDEAEFIAKQNT